jgi:hypothetical protein
VLQQHRVCLALGGVRAGDGVDDGLGLFVTDLCDTYIHQRHMTMICSETRLFTLVVFDNVSKMVAPRVMGFAHAHRVVREIDITVVTCMDHPSQLGSF